MISLLMWNKVNDDSSPVFGEDMLHLREVIRKLDPDKRTGDVAYRVMMHPACDKAAIYERQAITQDFFNYPELPAVLFALSEKDRHIRQESDAMKKHLLVAGAVSQQAARDKNRQKLIGVSACASGILAYLNLYKHVYRSLQNCRFSSAAMNQMQAYFAGVCAEPVFSKFGGIMQTVAEMHEKSAELSVHVLLEDLGRFSAQITDAGLQSVKLRHTPGEAESGMLYELSSIAAAQLEEWLNRVFSAFSEPIQTLGEEALFYQFAVRYRQTLKEKGLPLVFPSFEGDTVAMHITELISMDLIGGRNQIYPHDVQGAGLTIISGKNGAGKTTYLRAVATAQIFAQAGLPIPAKEAVLYPVDKIFLEFAGKESDTGRFEDEVRRMRLLVDRVTPRSMVFLNEMFQSTSYEEIAQAYLTILHYITERGATVMAVTHNEYFLRLCAQKRADAAFISFASNRETVR